MLNSDTLRCCGTVSPWQPWFFLVVASICSKHESVYLWLLTQSSTMAPPQGTSSVQVEHQGPWQTSGCDKLGWHWVEHLFPDEMAPQYSVVLTNSSFDRLWKRAHQVDILTFAPFPRTMLWRALKSRFTSVSIRASVIQSAQSLRTWFKGKKASIVSYWPQGRCLLTPCLWCIKWHTGKKVNLSTGLLKIPAYTQSLGRKSGPPEVELKTIKDIFLIVQWDNNWLRNWTWKQWSSARQTFVKLVRVTGPPSPPLPVTPASRLQNISCCVFLWRASILLIEWERLVLKIDPG